jgi:hypothetical protein
MLKAFSKTLGLLFLFIAVGLYFDSTYFLSVTTYGQQIANVLLLVVTLIVLYKASPRYKEQMVYAIAIGIAGEYIFSIGLGMYSYRLGNIPHYIPLGHAIVYIAVIYFLKQKAVILHKKMLERVLGIFISLYTLFFLLFFNDVYGFVLTVLILILLRNKPRERLFYYTMYLVVAYLELVGTGYQAWFWPSYAFDKFTWIPSANPPSGISFFYFGLDLGCLWLYKKRHNIAWQRMKFIRNLSSQK